MTASLAPSANTQGASIALPAGPAGGLREIGRAERRGRRGQEQPDCTPPRGHRPGLIPTDDVRWLKKYLRRYPSTATLNHNVKCRAETIQRNLDLLFGALSDATRRSIVERLAAGEATVTELALRAPFDISLPAISRHLKVLENASLITREASKAGGATRANFANRA